MRAVIEDIAGRGVDGDSAGIGCGIWFLPVCKSQSVDLGYHSARGIQPSV